jgi:hypothetical protein
MKVDASSAVARVQVPNVVNSITASRHDSVGIWYILSRASGCLCDEVVEMTRDIG